MLPFAAKKLISEEKELRKGDINYSLIREMKALGHPGRKLHLCPKSKMSLVTYC